MAKEYDDKVMGKGIKIETYWNVNLFQGGIDGFDSH